MDFDNDEHATPKVENSIATDDNETSVVPVRPMTEDETYILTQSVRRKMVMEMTRDHIPRDPEEAEVLLKVLDSMDKQALSLRKIKLEENVADNDAQVKELIASLLTHPDIPSLIKDRNENNEAIEGDYEVVIPADVAIPEFVDGQDSINPGQLDYQTLMDSTTSAES